MIRRSAPAVTAGMSARLPWRRPRGVSVGSDGHAGGDQTRHEGTSDLKHPKHLKGREIGLWYAQRDKSGNDLHRRNRQKREFVYLNSVSFDDSLARLFDPCLGCLEAEMQQRKQAPGRPSSRWLVCGSLSNGPRKLPVVPDYIKASRVKLPVFKARAEVLRTISENQVTIISGETGSGKTTQVPQFILDQFLEDETRKSCFIACTQPRRISAISVAERVAEERGELIGENSVGYKIRLESKEPRGSSGKILFCTTGIILQFLQSDPLLGNITHLIVDEVHERSIDSDLLLAVLRQNILPKRPDLKVICMSATLDSSTFVGYFGEACRSVSVDGKLFPIQERFLEEFLETLPYHPPPSYLDKKALRERTERADRLRKYGYKEPQVFALSKISAAKVDCSLVVACVQHICATKGDGAILVFMPGWEGISEVCRKLSECPAINRGNPIILPLHSMLPTEDQRRVFDVPPEGVRKIIVSTIISETSVTIEDVVFVVDSGKTKIKTIDVGKDNLNCLSEQWISKANARQRLGRAGRVRAGECYKLYTKMDYENMEQYQQPEMVRSSLENLILYVKELELGEPEEFLPQCISPPSSEAIANSKQFLIQLKALDKHSKVTALGKYLASLPTEPRLGKMLLLGKLFGCEDAVTSICAALDFKEPFVTPLGKRQNVDAVRSKFADGSRSDHVMVANAIQYALDRGEAHYRDKFLSFLTMRMLKNLRKQYKQHLKEQKLSGAHPNFSLETLRAVICGGLYPGIAMARCPATNSKCRYPTGGSVRLARTLFSKSESRICFHSKSVLSRETESNTLFFAYFLKQRGDNGVALFDATAVHPLSLLIFAAECEYDIADKLFTVNNWMRIHSEPEAARLIKRLRAAFDHVLDCFLRHKHSDIHRDLIDLLNRAFDQEWCKVVPLRQKVTPRSDSEQEEFYRTSDDDDDEDW
ncbi:ATP-dependent DNA/RNA helicase DHX36 [Galendromus occidentalis]|uniref:ATP-dependent DNA/RNA helicase DHX36 n=1 Tax=Galendromus occidentalis TaxID=34638 RepID=A0AAJ6W0W6_9ACAR|nr:ATP-dependent DNA/RNA helicase DHX36 [Galendromus occidentalis]